jgi:hypothetical protein
MHSLSFAILLGGLAQRNARGSYSGNAGFQSWPEQRLSWLSMFMVFLSPAKQIPSYFLDLATAATFGILSNSAFIYYPTIRRSYKLATDNSVK